MAANNNSFWETDNPQNEFDELTARGFTVNPHTGEIEGFNEAVFAAFIHDNIDIIYSASDKRFYFYDQGYWQYFETDYLRKYMFTTLQEPRFGIWRFHMESGYIEALKRELYISTPLNSYKHLINVENGMLDINNGKLLSHDKEYYSTIRIPVEYDKTAKCPQFDKFCTEIFEGDTQRINVLNEWMGLLLSEDVNAQKALILYGSGANGKSVLLTILEELIGKANISNVMLSQLNDKFTRVSLNGKTANICSENDDGYFSSAYFKQITAGDPVHAAYKYGADIDFTPSIKFVFAMNSLPNTRDFSEGYYRRLCILHFSAYFPPERQDPKLAEKLKTELAGILNFSLQGLFRIRANNYKFSPCDSADNLLEQYRKDQNPVLMFVADKVIASDSSRVENTMVIASFKQWARENSFKSFENISPVKFWRMFEHCCNSKGIKTENKHSSNVRYHTGITLKDSSSFQTPSHPRVTKSRLLDD